MIWFLSNLSPCKHVNFFSNYFCRKNIIEYAIGTFLTRHMTLIELFKINVDEVKMDKFISSFKNVLRSFDQTDQEGRVGRAGALRS